MGSIPPFIQQILGALVRAAVVAAAGYLAAHAGVTLSEDQIGSLVTYLVPIVAMLAWSLYSKYHGRLKLLTALSTHGTLTEQEVEDIVKDPAKPNPSVNTPKNEVPQ